MILGYAMAIATGDWLVIAPGGDGAIERVLHRAAAYEDALAHARRSGLRHVVLVPARAAELVRNPRGVR